MPSTATPAIDRARRVNEVREASFLARKPIPTLLFLVRCYSHDEDPAELRFPGSNHRALALLDRRNRLDAARPRDLAATVELWASDFDAKLRA